MIRLIGGLLAPDNARPWEYNEEAIDYKEDKTQWVSGTPPITVVFDLLLNKDDDPALISFVEKIANRTVSQEAVTLSLARIVESEESSTEVHIDGVKVDDKAAKEIKRRLEASNLLFLYNSTAQHEEIYFSSGRRRSYFDFVMSVSERRTLEAANKSIEKQIKRLAKDHVQGLTEILDKLSDRYEVELTPPEGFTTRRMPLSINLKDKSVEVPINDWGSGTQNRTHILMAILRANRIRRTASPTDKITPLVIVEEPESFLHPSAQAEFGRVLRHLSTEFGIQIIVTTHSPYMLNQEMPSANILLARKARGVKLAETEVVPTEGEQWMAPFADHLGIKSGEFSNLRSLFSADQTKALLVEGTTDREYFLFLQQGTLPCEQLRSDIEIGPYGGKDTLKNTVLLKFVLDKFDKVFVTYDLDAQSESATALARAGLKDSDHSPLGMKQSGKDCIEGLLPKRILNAVNGRETDLVMKLGSTKERREAKDQLKKKYLEEFMSHSDYTEDELAPLSAAIKKINAKFGSS